MAAKPIKHCVFLLLDGARADLFEQFLGKGKLPHIKEHITDPGHFSRAVTCFPSTTGPAYTPFLMGCYPGTVNLPGIRWMHKKQFGSMPFGLRGTRSYVGIGAFRMDKDIDSSRKTLFEILNGSKGIYSPITRGLSLRTNVTKFCKPYDLLRAHFTLDWQRVDDSATKHTLRTLESKPPFLFSVFPAIDENAHRSSPHSEKTIRSYEKADATVGKIAEKLKQLGIYDETLLVISSDHGLTHTTKHFELWEYFEERGLKALYYPKIYRPKTQLGCMISGNGMAHLYLRNIGRWKGASYFEDPEPKVMEMIDSLVKREEIDVIAMNLGEKRIRVQSKRGEAIILDQGGTKLSYQVVTQDPFGYPDLPKEMDFDQSLSLTYSTDYPDAPAQLAQLFRSPRSGDMVVTSNPGYDLRLAYEKPEHHSTHGSLHTEHMHVPLCFSRPIKHDGAIRTVDVCPTILKFLDTPCPHPTDGRALV